MHIEMHVHVHVHEHVKGCTLCCVRGGAVLVVTRVNPALRVEGAQPGWHGPGDRDIWSCILSVHGVAASARGVGRRLLLRVGEAGEEERRQDAAALLLRYEAEAQQLAW